MQATGDGRAAVAGLDELENELRSIPGVLAVGFTSTPGLLVVELEAGPDADADLPRAATVLVDARLEVRAAVAVVRSAGAAPGPRDPRLRLVEVTTDPAAGDIAVHLARRDERAIGRATAAHGLLGAVEATVNAIHGFLPDLPFLPGWARLIETTAEKRFLVVSSVTDPDAQTHLRGVAEGSTPLEGAVRATLAALNRTMSPEL
jgi:hypothetical protein